MNEALSLQEEMLELRAENESLRREVGVMSQLLDSLENLMDAVQVPRSDSEIMELLGRILDDAMHTTNAEAGSLLVLDEENDELVFVLTGGDGPDKGLKWRRLPRTNGIAGWVASNRHATIVNDVQEDDRFYDRFDAEFQFRTRSILAAPILGFGRVLGVIEVVNKRDRDGFGATDQSLLSLLCRFAGELLVVTMERQAQEGSKTFPEVS